MATSPRPPPTRAPTLPSADVFTVLEIQARQAQQATPPLGRRHSLALLQGQSVPAPHPSASASRESVASWSPGCNTGYEKRILPQPKKRQLPTPKSEDGGHVPWERENMGLPRGRRLPVPKAKNTGTSVGSSGRVLPEVPVHTESVSRPSLAALKAFSPSYAMGSYRDDLDGYDAESERLADGDKEQDLLLEALFPKCHRPSPSGPHVIPPTPTSQADPPTNSTATTVIAETCTTKRHLAASTPFPRQLPVPPTNVLTSDPTKKRLLPRPLSCDTTEPPMAASFPTQQGGGTLLGGSDPSLRTMPHHPSHPHQHHPSLHTSHYHQHLSPPHPHCPRAWSTSPVPVSPSSSSHVPSPFYSEPYVSTTSLNPQFARKEEQPSYISLPSATSHAYQPHSLSLLARRWFPQLSVPKMLKHLKSKSFPPPGSVMGNSLDGEASPPPSATAPSSVTAAMVVSISSQGNAPPPVAASNPNPGNNRAWMTAWRSTPAPNAYATPPSPYSTPLSSSSQSSSVASLPVPLGSDEGTERGGALGTSLSRSLGRISGRVPFYATMDNNLQPSDDEAGNKRQSRPRQPLAATVLR